MKRCGLESLGAGRAETHGNHHRRYLGNVVDEETGGVGHPHLNRVGDARHLFLEVAIADLLVVRRDLGLEFIVVDHEPATRNVPRSAREWGQDVEPVVELERGVWQIEVIKRTGCSRV